MRSALGEVSARISAAPSGALASGSGAVPFGLRPEPVAGGEAGALQFIHHSLEALAERARQGLPQAAAAFALVSQADRLSISRIAAELSTMERSAWADAGVDMDRSSAVLYRLASSADAENRTDDAILILGILAGTGWGERDGCLGLAVIAARMRRFEEAMALATYCLDAETRHPRALCIVGICELERGNVAGAQSYLAAAARVARTDPAFREDLQAAQRALLLMHLS